jgi:hypothetical protein
MIALIICARFNHVGDEFVDLIGKVFAVILKSLSASSVRLACIILSVCFFIVNLFVLLE